MTKRILITGGAGFIGSHLARAHIAEGDEVHVLVRPAASLRADRVHRNTIVHRVDLRDYAALLSCLAATRAQVIYHLATDAGRNRTLPDLSDLDSLTTDLDNVLRLAAAAANAPAKPDCFITAQSIAVYGNGLSPSIEDQREAPLAPYTASMVAAGHYLSVMQPRLPFSILHARFGLTFGPGQASSFFIPWLIERCLAGEPSEIRTPEDRRDFVHVEDVTAGLIAMSRKPLHAGTIINLSCGKAPTVREVAELIIELTGAPRGLVTLARMKPDYVRGRALCARTERARELLGWRPRVSLREGIARMVSRQVAQRV